ncbi:MAG: hypothetical protein AB8H79_20105 [Myxococcota bacterium]
MAEPAVRHWRLIALLSAALLCGGPVSHASEPTPEPAAQRTVERLIANTREGMADGRWTEVLAMLEPSLEQLLAQERVDNDAILELEVSLAACWSHLGLPDRAIEVFKRRFERIQAVHGPDAPATFLALAGLNERLQTYGDPAVAEAALTTGLTRSEAALGTDHLASRRMRIDLARAQQDQRRFSEAITTLRPALDGIDVGRHDLHTVVAAHLTMGDLLATVGDESWRDGLDEAVKLAIAHEGPDSFELAHLYYLIVLKGGQKGRSDYEALIPIAKETIRIRRHHSGLSHPNTIQAELQLVHLQMETGRLAEARVNLESITSRSDSVGDIATVLLQKQLAELLFGEDDMEGALAVRQSIARHLPLLPKEVVGIFGIVNDLSLSWILLRLDRPDEAKPIVERCMAAINADLLERLTENGEAALIHLIQQWDVALHLILSTRPEAAFDQDNWEALLVWRGLGPRLLAHRAQQVRSDPELWSIYKKRSALRRELADRVGQLHRSPLPRANTTDTTDAQRSEADRLEEEILQRLGPPPTPESLSPGVADLCATLDTHTSLVNIVTWTNLSENKKGKHQYDAFVLSGRDCRVSRVPLGRRDDIEANVKRWRRLITAQGTPPEFVAKAGADVAHDLLIPLMPHLQRTKRLIVVPEGALALVAWGGAAAPRRGLLSRTHGDRDRTRRL